MADKVIRVEPNPSQEIQLGEEYRDTVTGLVGVATCIHTYLNGCVHVSLEPRLKPSDPVPKETSYHSFDEARLVLVKTDEPVKATAKRGGPADHVPPRFG